MSHDDDDFDLNTAWVLLDLATDGNGFGVSVVLFALGVCFALYHFLGA